MRDIDLNFDWNGERIRITSARLRTAADADFLIRALGIIRRILPGGEVEPIPPATVAQAVQRPAGALRPTSQAGGDAVKTPATISPERAQESETAAPQVRDMPASATRLPDAASDTPNVTAPVAQPDDDGPADSTASIPQTSGATIPAGKSVGPSGSAAPSLLSRVRAYMEANPDSTVRECADALGADPVKVRNTAKGEIAFGPSRSPTHRRADRIAAQARDGVDGTLAGQERESPTAASAEPVGAFEPPDGEMIERTRKRAEVAALHLAEPWLTPEEAATRCLMPLVNLRIFTTELGIEWSLPMDAAPPAGSALPETRTLRDRVAALHRMRPNWSAGLIAKELGCGYGSASTYLAEARRVEKERAVA